MLGKPWYVFFPQKENCTDTIQRLREQSANVEQEQGSNSPDTMRHSREQSVDVKQEQRHNSPGRRKTRRNDKLIIIELDDDGEVIRERTTKVDTHVDAVVDLED